MLQPSQNSSTILTAERDGVLTICLNRPERLNAFNEEMHLALRAALMRARDDAGIRAVLLQAAGKGFCAGQDLGNRDPRGGGSRTDLGQSLEQFYNPTIRLIRSLEKPVVCAVNGVAAGAGVSLALACDMVFAASSARFVLSFGRLGLVPDAGASWFLTRVLGPARARGLVMTGATIMATEARDWGLIWRMVPDEDLAALTLDQAMNLAAGPTRGIGMGKALLEAAVGQGLDAQLDLERDMQRLAGFTADYAEGVTAFLEKRQPRFRGE